MGIEFPLITIVGGELAAVRTLPPAQTSVGKQELRQPDPIFASGLQFVDPLGSRLVHRIPWRIGISADPAGWNQVAMGVALILDIDSQAARTGLRSGRSVKAIAGPHRSLRARARSCTMC